MISNRPYLLRAFYEWIVDSDCTPIIVFDANNPRCKMPKDYAEGGEIVFNVSPTAIRDLKIKNDVVEFKASFSGVIHFISAPINAVFALYAEENGEGIFFDAEEEVPATDTVARKLTSIEGFAGALNPEISTSEPATKGKPFLTLVE